MLVRCRNRAEAGWLEPETGWFGSKLVKSVSHAVSSAAKIVTKPVSKVANVATHLPGANIVAGGLKAVSHVPGVSLALSPYRVAADVATGRNVVSSVKQRGGEVVQAYRAALPAVASAVSFVPGVGQGVGSGINALSAASQGKSPAEIAQAAVIGFVPGGPLARAALRAGLGVAQGRNVFQTVGREAASAAGGQLGERAFNVGTQLAKGANVAKTVGREAVSYAASSLPANINTAISTVAPKVPMQFGNLVRPNFGMPRSISPENVGRARSVIGLTRPQMQRTISPSVQRKASFRPLAKSTRQWLVRGLPHMRGEVSGLSETGAQWIVESGDTGSKIAIKLTGNANRWTELKAVNPKIMGRGAELVKKYGFPIYVGDLVNLPAGWIKVTAQTPAQSAPAQPSATTQPPVVMPQGDIAAQGQARAILTAWGKTDGVREAGVPDYGAQSELQATSWSARDILQATSFANWWKRNGGTPSVSDGNWSDALAIALNQWAKNKATAVANSAQAAGGVVVPQPTQVTPQAAPTQPWSTNPAPTTPATPATPAQSTTPVTPFPSTITSPTPQPKPQANTAPQQATGLTSGQMWGIGSMAAGTALSIALRLMIG